MSFGGVLSTLGRLSGTRRRNTIANSSGREPRVEGDLAQERNPPSTKDSGRKRSKSVTFSSVDLISDVTTTTMGPIREHPPTSSLHGTRPHSRSRRNTVASPKSSVPMSHSYTPSYSGRPHLPSHKPRRHTVTTSPFAYASCTRPKEDIHPHRDKRPSDPLMSYNDAIIYSSHAGQSPTTTPYVFSHTGGLNTSPNHHPTFVYASRPMSPEQGAVTSCALFIEPCHFPRRFRVEDSQHTRSVFEKHRKHSNYVVRLLTSELAPSFSSNGRPESVVLLDAGVNQALPPIFRSPLPLWDGNILIEKAPNKGLGMFAQRMLRTGELILTEHPTLVMPYVIAPGTPVSGIYQQMFNLLSKHLRHELLDLAASTFCGGAYVDENDVYESIVRINTLAVSLPVPHAGLADHRAIFLKLGRCNHSCGPNARWFWDPSSFSVMLTALRPINPGDEITIAYLPPYAPFYERRSALSRQFSFDCICEQCLRVRDWKSADVRVESDRAREFVARFWENEATPSFEQWCQDPFYSDDILIRTHERALTCIKREGLEVLSSIQRSPQSDLWPPIHRLPVRDVIRHMDAIATCYGALGDADNFRKWLTAAFTEREHDVLDFIQADIKEYQAAWEKQRLVFGRWMSNPGCLPVWGWRKTRWGRTHSERKGWQRRDQ